MNYKKRLPKSSDCEIMPVMADCVFIFAVVSFPLSGEENVFFSSVKYSQEYAALCWTTLKHKCF